MASLPPDADYYDLAEEDYDLTRQAIRHFPAVTTPGTLSPERLQKFIQMKAEYRLLAARLQAVCDSAAQMQDEKLIVGVRGEMCRAVVASGDLATKGIMPSQLTRELTKLRLAPGHGAPFLLEFGLTGSYFPGFADDLKLGEKDKLPSLEDMRRDVQTYSHICRAAGLRAVDDMAWWRGDFATRTGDAADIIRAAEAAECLIRVPRLLNTRNAVVRRTEPYPVEGIADLLGGLNALEPVLIDVKTKTEADLRRRKGRLLSEFVRSRGTGSLSAEDLGLLHEYKARRL